MSQSSKSNVTNDPKGKSASKVTSDEAVLMFCYILHLEQPKATIQFTVKAEHVNSMRGSVASSLICRIEDIFPRHNWTSLDFSEPYKNSGA